MTKVTITRQDNHIIKVECIGHTDYAEHGEDIICAALSSIVQTALLGLMQVAGVPAEYSTDEEIGYLMIEIPNLNDKLRHNADMILETMLIGINDLHLSYSDFIELEVI